MIVRVIEHPDVYVAYDSAEELGNGLQRAVARRPDSRLCPQVVSWNGAHTRLGFEAFPLPGELDAGNLDRAAEAVSRAYPKRWDREVAPEDIFASTLWRSDSVMIDCREWSRFDVVDDDDRGSDSDDPFAENLEDGR